MTIKVVVAALAHKRHTCPMSPDDVMVWCRVGVGHHKFWATLVTTSIRQDQIDSRIMTLITEGHTIFNKAMAQILPTNQETIQ